MTTGALSNLPPDTHYMLPCLRWIVAIVCNAIVLEYVDAQDGNPRATGAIAIRVDLFESLEKMPPPPGAPLGHPRISLRNFLPRPRDQGDSQTCTSFAVAYGLRTYLENKRLGVRRGNFERDDSQVFSPAFIHGSLLKAPSEGAYVQNALEQLTSRGCCTWKQMPFDQWASDSAESWKHIRPTQAQYTAANQYRHPLPRGINAWDPVDVKNQRNLKRFLAAGDPVVIVAYVDTSVLSESGECVWARDESGVTRRYLTLGPTLPLPDRTGCHAMLLTGYDETLAAFEVMNSWGENWGPRNDGFAWIGYDFWPSWVAEGYVVSDDHMATLDDNAGVAAADLSWLPIGPKGGGNGNWGYPNTVNLSDISVTREDTFPLEVWRHLRHEPVRGRLFEVFY